ncbi:hypothetical protein M9Y10_016047 [Tritrichomonas musculus]|uniref:Uncharacterized protein n=1 Tax=Tritrichomonas musculus TaxID=1915356 RepID=A0ABR2I5X6_9EUKA
MEFKEISNLTYCNCSEDNPGNNTCTNKWNRIIILDKNKNPIKDRTYLLDQKERLVTKIKRQRRRDLGKVTGKKKVPKNWKQIIENLDDPAFQSLNITNNPMLSPCESQSSTSANSDQETQQFDPLSYDKLISIDWLLNQPAELSSVF